MPQDHSDVLVVGGGPAGVAAAVAASRAGGDVTIAERETMLGGAGTVNLVNNFINAYWDGTRYVIGGIFLEIRDRLFGRKAMYRTRGPTQGNKHGQEPFIPEEYADELRLLCEESGVDVRLGSTVTGATMANDRIDSIQLESGTELHGNAVVDATGNALLAENAGVPTKLGGDDDESIQPLTLMYMVEPIDLGEVESFLPRAVMHDDNLNEKWADLSHLEEVNELVRRARADDNLSLPVSEITTLRSVPREPDRFSVNFGYIQVSDPTDEDKLAAATREGREQVAEGVEFLREYVPGFTDAEVAVEGRRIGVRESRRIEGQYELTADDIGNRRQFDDVIGQSCFPFDIHSAEGDWEWDADFFEIGEHYDIPWRSLVPRSGPSNLIVAGKCISADRAAFSSVRISSSAMCIGEAAGVTAALAARDSTDIATVDVNEVQNTLEEMRAILE